MMSTWKEKLQKSRDIKTENDTIFSSLTQFSNLQITKSRNATTASSDTSAIQGAPSRVSLSIFDYRRSQSCAPNIGSRHDIGLQSHRSSLQSHKTEGGVLRRQASESFVFEMRQASERQLSVDVRSRHGSFPPSFQDLLNQKRSLHGRATVCNSNVKQPISQLNSTSFIAGDVLTPKQNLHSNSPFANISQPGNATEQCYTARQSVDANSGFKIPTPNGKFLRPKSTPPNIVSNKATSVCNKFISLIWSLTLCSLFIALLTIVISYAFKTTLQDQNSSVGTINLTLAIRHNLVGQHLVQANLERAIIDRIEDNDMLILLLFGSPGTGKSFTKSLIINYLVSNNFELMQRFASDETLELVDVSQICHSEKGMKQTSFVLKEKSIRDLVLVVEDAPGSLLPKLIELSQHFRNQIHNSCINKAVVIFVSPVALSDMFLFMMEQFQNKRCRTDIKEEDVCAKLNKSLPWLRGKRSDDHLLLLPFLPLEKRHVISCAEHRFKELGIEKSKWEQLTTNVLNEMEFFPNDTQLFSVWGCKKLSSRIDIVNGKS